MDSRFVLAIFVLASISVFQACGGSQSTPPPDPVSVAIPEPEPEPELPEAPPIEHVFYQVFWQDIHVLTVYRGGGTLRSEDSSHPADVFSGECAYMTAISHYFEHEAALRPFIDEADSVDGFFELLGQDSNYGIDEDYLEEGY